MPNAAAIEVISTGRKRRWPERTSASSRLAPSARRCSTKVQHENAVLGHDADADDRAQEGDDIQRSAGDPQRQHGAEQGQHRAEDDRDRFVERAELDQQHGEDKEDRHHQHQHEVAEGLLLLLVKAAELDRAGRQRLVPAQLLLDLRHRAAEVAAFEARGHGHVLPQIFAPQLQLPRLLHEVRHLRELDHRAVRRPQRQLAQRRHAVNVAPAPPARGC